MNATVLTTIIGLVIAAIGTIGFPIWDTRSKNKATASQEKSIDSREVALMFKNERDRLQTRLDTMRADYELRIQELRQDNARALEAAAARWREQHDRDQKQIADLREELQGVYRRLYRDGEPPPRHVGL